VEHGSEQGAGTEGAGVLMYPHNRDEFMAVWTALAQFVENNDPDDCNFTDEDRRVFNAAECMMRRFDAVAAKAATS
jgi:hypothetical protein